MAGTRPTRVRVLAALGIGLAGFGAMVTVGVGVGPDNQPDLVPLLPTARPGQPNDRWIDTVQEPGKVLYRFDTVILNEGGGTFDVYRGANDPTTFQKIWPNGAPDIPLSQAPTGGVNLGAAGQIRYSSVVGHNHFHTQLVAGYELDTTGGSLVAPAAKNTAGFCLYDSWASAQQGTGYFADGTICHPQDPGYSGVIREGISPSFGDFYGSQLGDQWVDVTGIVPGAYMLRAEANPARLYTESDTTNNVITDGVTIPGATAADASASTGAGTPVDVPLSGAVVGADVRSRKPTCTDSQTGDASCMTAATPGRLSFQVVSGPAAGTVQMIDAAPDSAAIARFTPAPGFFGTASFQYTTTDSRGLTSRPATVRVTVAGAGGPGGQPPITTAAKARVKIRVTFRITDRGSRPYLRISGTVTRSQSGRLVRVQAKRNARIVTLAVMRVSSKGTFTRTLRLSSHAVMVRALIGSTARARRAATPFRAVSG